MQYLATRTQKIPYEIRKSSKAKRGRISIHRGKVTVIIPRKVSINWAKEFAQKNVGWIEKKLNEPKNSDQLIPMPMRCLDGEEIYYLGIKYKLRFEISDEITPQVNPPEIGYLQVKIPKYMHVKYTEKQEVLNRDILLKWLVKQSCTITEKYIKKYNNTGLVPSSVRVKNQKSRWGSCSHKNSININWQLIFYPEAIFEYVIIHELCHIKHKNHSPAFWAEVARLMPDYSKQRDWIRKNANIIEI